MKIYSISFLAALTLFSAGTVQAKGTPKKMTGSVVVTAASSASAPSVVANKKITEANQKGLVVEVPLELVPSPIKDFVKTLGGFVEYQRTCKDTVEHKKDFQKYIKTKEDSIRIVYGLATLDYRDLLETGADETELSLKNKSTEDLTATCNRFLSGFPDYLKSAWEEVRKKDVNLIDINKELGIKSKLNAEAKALFEKKKNQESTITKETP